MDSGNTNNLNNENVNPNLNNTNEDLTNIFDTPVDLEATNLGVGETINEYTKEDTEILDLNEISEFKEAEIKVENLDINDIAISKPTVENNPFELNDLVNDTFDLVQETEVLNNNEDVIYTPSSVDDLIPVSLDSLNNNEAANEVDSFNQVEETKVVEQPIVDSEQSVSENNLESNVNDEVIIEQPTENNLESIENNETIIEQPAEPVMDGQTNVETPITEPVNKKKKNILPIIIVLVIVGILGALAAVYFLVLTTPKNIFNKAITGGIEYLSGSFNNIGKYNTIIGNGSISYEIKTEDASMQSMFDMFNGIDLDYEYGIDYQNKLMNFNIDSKYNNEKLLDLDLYTENNKLYMLFVDIYNTYITSPIEGYDNLFNTDIKQEELNVILNSFSQALTESLTDEDFVKDEETLKINGEDVKVEKNSFVLNNKNVNRIAKNILTILKDDADFISAVNKLSSDNSVDTKSTLEAAIENIGEVSSVDNTVIAVSIYTKGILKEVVGFSFEVKDDETIKIFVNKTVDNTYSYVITKGSEELLSGSIKVDITNSQTSNISNVELLLSMKDLGSLKLNLKNNVNYNAVFNKPDISTNISVEQLPENWMSNIAILAMNNPGFVKLMTNIQTISAQKEAETQQEITDIQNQMQSMETNYNYGY